MLPANDDGTIEWESGIGAGPYRFVDNEPGVVAQLVRHDGWHREGAYFDGVDITILNDAAARQTSLITGGCHLVGRSQDTEPAWPEQGHRD